MSTFHSGKRSASLSGSNVLRTPFTCSASLAGLPLLRLILRIQIPTPAPYDGVLAVFDKQSAALAGELNWSGERGEQVRRLFQSFVAVLDAEVQQLPGHPLLTRLRPIFARYTSG